MHSAVVGLHHSAFPVYLDTFDGCDRVKTIINAPKATFPAEHKDRLPDGHSLDAAALKPVPSRTVEHGLEQATS